MTDNKSSAVRYLWTLLTLVLLGLIGGYYWQQHALPAPTEALLDTVQRRAIEQTINATGSLEPRRFVEVGAQVSGQIQRIYVEEGDQVQAGDRLLDIDATVFETRVQNAEASLEGNRAQLQQLQAELALAQQRAKRNADLFVNKAVSEDALNESQASVRILEARIRAMQAQIKADEASLAGDKATLAFARIYAPIGGTVVSLSVREGQTLNANQNAPLLLKLADLSMLTLRAQVSEADVMRLTPGMPVYFKTFGGGERRWYSTVRLVLPTPSVINDVVLYQVLVDIDNADGQLMDAMTAQVFFVRNSAEDALVVPLGALNQGKNGATVWRQTGAGFEPVAVTLGVRNRTQVQVLSGLQEGDRIRVGIPQRDGRANGGAVVGGGPGGRRGF